VGPVCHLVRDGSEVVVWKQWRESASDRVCHVGRALIVVFFFNGTALDYNYTHSKSIHQGITYFIKNFMIRRGGG
jgi:hypothetical protein